MGKMEEERWKDPASQLKGYKWRQVYQMWKARQNFQLYFEKIAALASKIIQLENIRLHLGSPKKGIYSYSAWKFSDPSGELPDLKTFTNIEIITGRQFK